MRFEDQIIVWLVIFPVALGGGWVTCEWATKRLKSNQRNDRWRPTKRWLELGAFKLGFFAVFCLLMTFFELW